MRANEIAAAHMVFGAAGAGVRCLTSSSSPGISLMAEALSYIAACELPCVIVNIMRAGPGLGGILPAQSDYHQATRGHGHGDYQLIVLAPWSVQEAVDLMLLAFPLAERWRNPVMLCADGMIGQMMEPVRFPVEGQGPPMAETGWALTGCEGRERRVINSLYLSPEELHAHNLKLKAKYDAIAARADPDRRNPRRWAGHPALQRHTASRALLGYSRSLCARAPNLACAQAPGPRSVLSIRPAARPAHRRGRGAP